ncbi:MAG: division/cell wall cluster transcriptional repressor MraZ [Thermodesulfovibrionales bacterium]|nr:division/cell wall cluster transcriptional repressor MraZ [Thermodesulfovibrionales bacterium]
MSSFIGKFYHTLDSKGRVMLPAPLREALYKKYDSDKLFITNAGFDTCLHLFPTQEWYLFLEKIQKLPSMDEAVKFLTRRVVAGAVEVSIDKQGRILIPFEHRQDAKIAAEVVIVGQLNKIEIWDKSEWDAVTDPKNVDKKKFEIALAGYGL